MFKKFKSLFVKPEKAAVPPIPSWEKIVEIMYDKQLDCYSDEIVKVVYSKDKTKRYLVLKNKDIFTYQFEKIQPFDEDEWRYIAQNKDILPAQWVEGNANSTISLFPSEQDAEKALMFEAQYRMYF